MESDTCASFTAAIAAGHPVTAQAKSTLADGSFSSRLNLQQKSEITLGLAVPTVGGNSLATAQGLVDKVITVCEESIALSILRLLEMEKVSLLDFKV